jgi:hypothetical protein
MRRPILMSASITAQQTAGAEDLARVDAFLVAELKLVSGSLGKRELAKVRDLSDDVMRNASWLGADKLGHPTFLGRVFACFEFAARDINRVLHGGREDASAHGLTQLMPALCSQDFRLFDGLSQIHGGNFRGAVVLNALLALFASTVLLLSLTFFRDSNPWPTVIELICLVWIGLIFVHGQTPETDECDESASGANNGQSPQRNMPISWLAKRWHQRWLEYRLLAERFRYVELMLPLGAAMDVAIARPEDARRMWHQRYFEAQVAGTAHLSQTAREFRDHALNVMAHQVEYHRLNHAHRGATARLLNAWVKWAFVGALGACVGEIVLAVLGVDDGPVVRIVRTTLVFLSAWLPVLSAACYVIVSHAEYAKVADASREARGRIAGLYSELEAIRVDDLPATPESLKPLRKTVVDFVVIAITEATGWRAMLRDKNVPL